MTRGTKARVLSLEQDLKDIVEGKGNFSGNMTELDAVVDIAEQLLLILKGEQ